MKELNDLVKKVNHLISENVRLTERLHNIIVTLTNVHSSIIGSKGICSGETLEQLKKIINGDK